MVEKDLVVVEGKYIDLVDEPANIIERGRKAATVLKEIVSHKDKIVKFNGEQYLEYEDWQTIGNFYGATVRTYDAKFIEFGGVIGFKAYAELIDKHGRVIGGAEAYCMRDEEKWNTRPKYEWQGDEKVKIGDELVPLFQLASMAQTRAGAKAMSNKFRWVAVLAGYKGTPAEEMTGDESKAETTKPDKKYFCEKHKRNWFMKGKMQSYAHPVEGAKEWCYMPVETPEAPPAAPKEGQKVEEKTEPQFKTITAFLNWTAAAPRKLSRSDVLSALGVTDTSQIADLDKAKATIESFLEKVIKST